MNISSNYVQAVPHLRAKYYFYAENGTLEISALFLIFFLFP